jgi:hypothetical protein
MPKRPFACVSDTKPRSPASAVPPPTVAAGRPPIASENATSASPSASNRPRAMPETLP